MVAVGVQRWRRLARVGHHLGGHLRFVGHVVAQGGDLHARTAEELVHHRAAAQSRTDDRNAHGLVPLEGHTLHRLRPGRRARRQVRLRASRHRLGERWGKCAGRSKRGTGEGGRFQ